jgi:hypothetical protein
MKLRIHMIDNTSGENYTQDVEAEPNVKAAMAEVLKVGVPEGHDVPAFEVLAEGPAGDGFYGVIKITDGMETICCLIGYTRFID